jgi:hypothetical protein
MTLKAVVRLKIVHGGCYIAHLEIVLPLSFMCPASGPPELEPAKTTTLGAAEDRIVGMEVVSIIIQRFTVGEMREEKKVSRCVFLFALVVSAVAADQNRCRIAAIRLGAYV